MLPEGFVVPALSARGLGIVQLEGNPGRLLWTALQAILWA